MGDLGDRLTGIVASCSRGSPGRAAAARRARGCARASAGDVGVVAQRVARDRGRPRGSPPRRSRASCTAGVPDPDAGGDRRRPLVEGHRVAVAVIRTSASRSSASLPVHSERAQVDLEEMGVGAAREHVEAAGLELVGERVGVRAHLRLVLAERLGVAAIRKHVAFAAITCSIGPPCMPGKTARSSACACSSRQRTKPERGPGERLVRRRGDEVAVRHRVRVQARRRRAPRSGPCRRAAARPTSSAISRKRSASTVRG